MHDHDATQPSPTLPAGVPDGWLFDRDLSCPECNYNLRMLSQPRCPECGTVFRWQTLLHISCPRCGEGLETIDGGECPRCGLELNWEELLGDADPALHRHFEYTTKPIRAIVPTWFAALRPARFWRRIPLESPPAVKRLRRLRKLTLIITVLVIAAAEIISPGIKWSLTRLTNFYMIALESISPFSIILTLPIVTFIALPRFAPTLSRFRVRRDQLLRLAAYSAAGAVFAALILLTGVLVKKSVNIFWPVTTAWGGSFPRIAFAPEKVCFSWLPVGWYAMNPAVWYHRAVGTPIILLSFVWWWRFLCVGLREYLRLDRRNTIALIISTQAVSLLIMLLLLVFWVCNTGYGLDVLIGLERAFGQ